MHFLARGRPVSGHSSAVFVKPRHLLSSSSDRTKVGALHQSAPSSPLLCMCFSIYNEISSPRVDWVIGDYGWHGVKIVHKAGQRLHGKKCNLIYAAGRFSNFWICNETPTKQTSGIWAESAIGRGEQRKGMKWRIQRAITHTYQCAASEPGAASPSLWH